MEIKRGHWIGVILFLIITASSFFFIGTKFFFLIIGMGVLAAAFPFVFSVIYEERVRVEKEEMFLEFARNLVESVKTGTSISKSIINARDKPYGVLSENVRKLANQISMGIPLNVALNVFSKDVDNNTISRALTLIGQAEKAGGNISEILESVADAVNMSDRLKKERRAAISNLVVQGYIIFFIFMVIVLVMQFKLVPILSGISNLGILGSSAPKSVSGVSPEEVAGSFFYLLLVQGFFSGLMIGKLSEGNIKAGIRHSFFLTLSSFLVSAMANLFIGG